MPPYRRIRALSDSVVKAARDKQKMIATVESCTGGMIAAAITDIPGASAIFDRGFITYSNAAKSEILGVPAPMIETHGAVSREVARAMAQGGLAHSSADIVLSVTGIAGPEGGTPEKPVGLVWFGLARRQGQPREERFVYAGESRDFVRRKAVETALEIILSAI